MVLQRSQAVCGIETNECAQLLIEGIHRPSWPGYPLAAPWDLPATGYSGGCQLHGRPAKRGRERHEWLRVRKPGQENGIATKYDGEAAQLMRLLDHEEVGAYRLPRLGHPEQAVAAVWHLDRQAAL